MDNGQTERQLIQDQYMHTSTRVSIPVAVSVSGASGPPGLAATATIGAPANLVVARVRLNRLHICDNQEIYTTHMRESQVDGAGSLHLYREEGTVLIQK